MNTPFYGWGLAGRVETTALVLQVLEKGETTQQRTQDFDELIREACCSFSAIRSLRRVVHDASHGQCAGRDRRAYLR